MSGPRNDHGPARRDPETGGRSLADILREAGVEGPPRTRRRRGDDGEDTGVRQRGADTGRVAERPTFGRRASDRTGDPAPPVPDRRRGAPEPSTAAIPGLRPSRKPGVPGSGDTGRTRRAADAAAGPSAGPSTGPSTGPIPVVRAGAPATTEEPLGPREGAVAWLRFGGELLLALAAGVGIYFLFTVLWELLPYGAVVIAPVVVAGLVGGVGAWRQRQDREPVGLRLLAVLVFAGTLLTIAPAAALLGGS